MKYEYDNIHYSLQNLLSHNKPYNFVVSCRGSGKTTDIVRYMYKLHKKGKMLVVIRRQIVDCSETYIKDLENNINRWLDEDERIKFRYKKGDIKEGLLDVYINDEEQPFFRLIALSNPVYRLKGQCFLENNLRLIFFDEYKISAKEKYLEGEYNLKFKELYTTLARFGDGHLTTIFAGNNYSITDPYVAGMHIPVNKIVPGKILVGSNYAFEDYIICDELKKEILKQNPLFSFGEDSYMKYAFEGRATQDERIRLVETQPNNYKLRFVFSIEGQKLGVYMNNKYWDIEEDTIYWASVINEYDSKNRNIYCFDFTDLVDGTVLLDSQDKKLFVSLKRAFNKRFMTFKTVNEAYLFEQIYENI